MYELSETECVRRLAALQAILANGQARDPGFSCACSEAARGEQEALVARARAGDESSLTQLLEYYQNCINSWAKDICPTEAAQAYFKADLVASLMANVQKLDSYSFCADLHVAATRVAIAQHEHLLTWHQRDRIDAGDIPEAGPGEALEADGIDAAHWADLTP